MREILFRGRVATSPEALEELDYKGVQHKNGWVFGAYTDGFIVSGVAEVNEEYIAMEQWGAVDPETVGQYIERTATKVPGQKVFEGDIIRAQVFEFSGMEGRSREFVGPVIFREGAFWMDVIDQVGWLPALHEVLDIEVLGNIHDNPELLEAPRE